MSILKYFQSEIFLCSSSRLCHPCHTAHLTLAVLGELRVPLEGFPLSAYWRCSLDRTGSGCSSGEFCQLSEGCQRCCQVAWDRAGASVSLLRVWAAVTQGRGCQSHSHPPCGQPLCPCQANLSAGQRDPVWFKRLFCAGFGIYTGKLLQNLTSEKAQ